MVRAALQMARGRRRRTNDTHPAAVSGCSRYKDGQRPHQALAVAHVLRGTPRPEAVNPPLCRAAAEMRLPSCIATRACCWSPPPSPVRGIGAGHGPATWQPCRAKSVSTGTDHRRLTLNSLFYVSSCNYATGLCPRTSPLSQGYAELPYPCSAA